MASIWCREAQHFRMQGCKNDDNGSSSILLNFYNCFTSCNRKSNRWPGHIFLCFLFKMWHFLLILFVKIQKEDFRISKCNVLLTFLWDLSKTNMDNIRNPISSSSYLRLANFYAKNLANFFFFASYMNRRLTYIARIWTRNGSNWIKKAFFPARKEILIFLRLNGMTNCTPHYKWSHLHF